MGMNESDGILTTLHMDRTQHITKRHVINKQRITITPFLVTFQPKGRKYLQREHISYKSRSLKPERWVYSSWCKWGARYPASGGRYRTRLRCRAWRRHLNNEKQRAKNDRTNRSPKQIGPKEGTSVGVLIQHFPSEQIFVRKKCLSRFPRGGGPPPAKGFPSIPVCSSREWVDSTELYGSTTAVEICGDGYTYARTKPIGKQGITSVASPCAITTTQKPERQECRPQFRVIVAVIKNCWVKKELKKTTQQDP